MTACVAIEATQPAIEYRQGDSQDSDAELARRNQVVLDHLPLVKMVARRVAATLPVQVELNELIQAGTLGLIDAANKFDTERGNLFETYAKHRIRGAILDGLRQLDWASRGLRLRHNQLEAATQALTAELQRAPTEEEMAGKMGMDLADWREMSAAVANFKRVHGSSQAGEEDDEARVPEPPSQPESYPDHICARVQLSDTVQQVIELLPDRSQKIVVLYYQREMTMREIGARIGLKESRVSQVHKWSLAKMAKALQVKGICSSQAF